MIIWTGWGILAGLLWFAGLLLTQVGVDQVYHQGYYTANVWPKLLGGVVASPLIWFLGRRMNGAAGSEQRRTLGAQHTVISPDGILGSGISIVGSRVRCVRYVSLTMTPATEDFRGKDVPSPQDVNRTFGRGYLTALEFCHEYL